MTDDKDNNCNEEVNENCLPNPVLSNMAVPELVNPGACGMPNTSTYLYQADYSDPDGDVDSDIQAQVHLQWSTGGTTTYTSDPVYNTITGDGYTGMVSLSNCLEFGSASWVDVTLTIWDESNHIKKQLSYEAGQ